MMMSFIRSFVYLTNILVGTSLMHKVAIVNDNGEVRGHLTVSVRFMLNDEIDEKSNSVLVEFDGFEEVSGICIQGTCTVS